MDAQVVVECPGCQDERTPHQLLKEPETGHATVKCTECGHVHKVKVEEPRQVERRVIVSQGDDSFKTHVPMEAEKEIKVGDEFVLESDEGVFGVEVRSLEVETEDKEGGEGNQRVDSVTAEEVETVWTQVIDNVNVDLTLHTAKGESKSAEMRVPGDYQFVVGEEEEVDGEKFEVTAFVTDEDRRFRLEGDDVMAKNAKRIYGETKRSRSGRRRR